MSQTEAAWRYEIKYGPEGEANYAWVYRGKEMVCVAKTHHAKDIVDAALASLSHTMGVKGDADEEMHEIGYRDGYEKAVQDIDQLTGGDGEYRYCTDHDPDRHTPDADTMKQRIVERFETLNTMESVSEINEWQSRATAAEASAERNGKWLDDLARAVVEHFRIEEPSDGFYDIHTTAHEILNGDFTTDSDADRRAESAEKRIAELEAERAHSEAAKGVNTQYAWALFHLGLSDDDDPEEFGRQLSDKIDGLEADLQQAMDALEPFARAALGVGTVWSDDLKLNHPEVDHVLPLITVGDLRRAKAARR